jgi:CelD/BcsL family acetyltransferase involved in cellulose biosynthesis
MISWWRNAAPKGAELRVAIAAAGDELLGLAPFFVHYGRGDLVIYRLLGSGKSMPMEILAREGWERNLAPRFAHLLRDGWPRPDVVSFDGISTWSAWPEMLTKEWPQSQEPWLHRDVSRPSPTVHVGGKSYDQWFESKTRNFRQQMRRAQRQLEKRGAVTRLVTDPAELKPKLDEFARLHHQRWVDRGGSNALNRKIEAMLLDAGREMMSSERFQLWTIEVDGKDISSHLFVRAGNELAYWLGGFDDEWASTHPAMVTILAAIEHACETGIQRVNLGAGGRPYKYRFSDAVDTLDWITIAPHKPRYPVTRLQLLPRQVGHAVARRLSPETKQRVKNALGSRRRPSSS